MFNTISWQEFFTTSVILLSGYYAITTLLLYSKEITNVFLQKKPNLSDGSVHANQMDSNTSNALMGSVRYEHSNKQNAPREETIEMDAVEVAPSQEVEEPVNIIDLRDEALNSDFVLLMDEIGSLAEISSLGTKEEAISLFKTLLSNYPQLVGTPFHQPASQRIHDCLNVSGQHQFDRNEINTWWPPPNHLSTEA